MKLISILVFALPLFAQTTNYPGALDNDSSLFVVADNVQSSASVRPVATTDNVGLRSERIRLRPEHDRDHLRHDSRRYRDRVEMQRMGAMLITAVNGQALTVTRGVAGTSARSQLRQARLSRC